MRKQDALPRRIPSAVNAIWKSPAVGLYKAGMNEQELRKRLELLRTEHRDLDAAIAALSETGSHGGSGDHLQIARLKKRKLRLKDQIAIIEDTLLPDIIA